MQSFTIEKVKAAFSVLPEFNEHLATIDKIPINESLVLMMREISQERFRQFLRLTKDSSYLEPVNIISCLGLFSVVGAQFFASLYECRELADNESHFKMFFEAQVHNMNPPPMEWKKGEKWFAQAYMMEMRVAAALIEQLQLRAIKPFYREPQE